MKKISNLSRRDFLGTMAAATAFTVVPRSVLGGAGYTAPSDLVNVAGIGIGAQGGGDIRQMCPPDEPIGQRQGSGSTRAANPPAGGIQVQQQRPPAAAAAGAGVANTDAPIQMGNADRLTVRHCNIYALCDVDHNYAGHIMAGYPKAKRYKDFREMIDKEKSIDAVVIGGPDHTHAVMCAYAMKAGKHVFVEKPMCKTIHETRFLADLAKKNPKLVTQVGNQGHNTEGTMQTYEWIRSGAIGNVTEVHMWSNRPSWPQGNFFRPAGVSIPEGFDWDNWIGPAPLKDYHPDIVHFNWRGLSDYGTGAMGDMGAHTFDAPVWALNLGYPTKIQATSTAYSREFLPQSEFVTYHFPARGNMPPVKVTWSDGGIKPARPDKLEADRALRECLYIGDKGMIMHGTHGAAPELIPRNPGFREPAKTLPRPNSVYIDFLEAIKEGRQTHNGFEFASKVTEIMLLTNVAVFSQRINTTLEYDGANMRVTNVPQANDLFHYEYRRGWSL